MLCTLVDLDGFTHRQRGGGGSVRTDNIRGFETRLGENNGPLKTTLRENETTLIENRPTTSLIFEPH